MKIALAHPLHSPQALSFSPAAHNLHIHTALHSPLPSFSFGQPEHLKSIRELVDNAVMRDENTLDCAREVAVQSRTTHTHTHHVCPPPASAHQNTHTYTYIYMYIPALRRTRAPTTHTSLRIHAHISPCADRRIRKAPTTLASWQSPRSISLRGERREAQAPHISRW